MENQMVKHRFIFIFDNHNFFRLEQIVVPTPEALANNLQEIKLIVADTKIKTIVTNITIDGLDQMKKDSREARDATR